MLNNSFKGYKMSKYYPKLKDVDVYFDMIDAVIFKNKLPKFDSVKRTTDPLVYGYVQSFNDENKTSNLFIKKWYRNKSFFCLMLAHQMCHLWQNKILRQDVNVDCHQQSFLQWEKTFEKYGLTLDIEMQPNYDEYAQSNLQQILIEQYNIFLKKKKK